MSKKIAILGTGANGASIAADLIIAGLRRLKFIENLMVLFLIAYTEIK